MPTASSRSRSRASTAWARSSSAGSRSPRCASRSIRARSRRSACSSTTSATRSPTTPSMRPRARSPGRCASYTVYANDQILDADAWNQLIVGYRTARRCASGTSARPSQGVENNQIGAWTFPGRANPDRPTTQRPDHPAGDLQAARRQRHPDRRAHQGGAAAAGAQHAPGGHDAHPGRPHPDHPRLGRGRRDHPADHDRPGGRCDLPVPAQRARHADPQRGDPAVAAGDRRGDAVRSASASTICR